jgi:polyvinyl alcohol dehydrogenase (cytochrome)
MMSIAYPLRRNEREAVAKFLGHGEDEPPLPASAFWQAEPPDHCAGRRARRGAGWSPSPSNTRFQPSASAGIAAADVPKLELKWAFGFPGDVTAFAAPTVLNGTVCRRSAGGSVHAIDAETGCLHWIYQATAPFDLRWPSSARARRRDSSSATRTAGCTRSTYGPVRQQWRIRP